jgi:hypothetical protein
MADPYLAVSAIANDEFMRERLCACATQQTALGNASIIENDPINTPFAYAAVVWVDTNKYLWASSPGWGEKWQYALDSNSESGYEPGKDVAVITDEDILATVQHLTNPESEVEPPPE